jgi:hypothetical protein
MVGLLLAALLVASWAVTVWFARPGTPPRILISVALCWACAAAVLVLLPLDIASANNGGSVVPPLVWRLIYWTALLLGWLSSEGLLAELAAGEFSTSARMRAAFRANLILFGGAALLAVGTALYLLVSLRLSPAALGEIAVTLVDGCGVLRLALLLGEGLVALPRAVWREAEPRARLRQLCYELGSLEARRGRAALRLRRIIAQVYRPPSPPCLRRIIAQVLPPHSQLAACCRAPPPPLPPCVCRPAPCCLPLPAAPLPCRPPPTSASAVRLCSAPLQCASAVRLCRWTRSNEAIAPCYLVITPPR